MAYLVFVLLESTNMLRVHMWARDYDQGEAFLIDANLSYGVISLHVF